MANCIESTNDIIAATSLTTNQSSPEITKAKVRSSIFPKTNIFFTIDNVFLSKEFSNILAHTEEQDEEVGYHEVTICNGDKRASHWCILDYCDFVNLLFKRIKTFYQGFTLILMVLNEAIKGRQHLESGEFNMNSL